MRRRGPGRAGNLTEPEAYGLMESYGIPTAPYTLAKSAEEAASAAEKLGYPVVMKVVSPQIIHKSDYGAESGTPECRCGPGGL